MHVLRTPLKGFAAGCKNLRLEPLKLMQIAAGLEHEHPAVPEEIAAGQIVTSGSEVWFFHEAVNSKAAGTDSRTFLYIAITGFSTVGYHTEGYQLAVLCERECRLNAGVECRNILD